MARRAPDPSTLLLPTSWEHGSTEPRSIVGLLADRVLDAELAALLWILVAARVPLVVAGGTRGVGKTTVLRALLDFVPPGTRALPLEGAVEDFHWLPEAEELGWRRSAAPGLPTRRSTPAPAHPLEPGSSPASSVLLMAELSDRLPTSTWGPQARMCIRALSIGYGLAATIHADRLEEVFERLTSAPVHLSDDELSRLGVVVIVRLVDPGSRGEPRRRVVAVHYVRPVARDQHGHVQRMPPAVLAAYEPQTDELEHYAWGVLPELAARVGQKAGDLGQEQRRRAEFLEGLLRADVTDRAAVRLALAGYQGTVGVPPA